MYGKKSGKYLQETLQDRDMLTSDQLTEIVKYCHYKWPYSVILIFLVELNGCRRSQLHVVMCSKLVVVCQKHWKIEIWFPHAFHFPNSIKSSCQILIYRSIFNFDFNLQVCHDNTNRGSHLASFRKKETVSVGPVHGDETVYWLVIKNEQTITSDTSVTIISC